MTNYYKLLDLTPKSSEWKIFKTFESKARENLSYELIKAVLILGDKKTKKFYDLLLKSNAIRKTNAGLKYISFIKIKEDKALKHNLEKVQIIISENEFWNKHGLQVFINCVGFNYFTKFREIDYHLSEMMLIPFLIKFGLRFLLPLLLTIYISYLFGFLLLAVFIFFCYLEYKKLKIKYYQNELIYFDYKKA